MKFSPELYRLIFSPKLNFSPSTKQTTEYCFELFFAINKFVFDFCCLCLFCYNARQQTISRQKHTGFSTGHIQCMKCIGNPLVRTDGRMEGRTYGGTDGHVTITSLPKFLGLIGY